MEENDHGDVRVCGLLTRPAGRWGLILFVADHVLRVPPLVVTSDTCCLVVNGCGCAGRLLEASRTLSNRGIARFIGDAVDALAVRFTAVSTPGDNKRQLYDSANSKAVALSPSGD